MDTVFERQPANKPQRPQLLTLLCILSFFGSGLGAVGSFFTYLFYDVIIAAIENEAFDPNMLDLSFFAVISKSYFLINGLLMVISFTGVMHMWKLRRAGFHLYALSQLMILIVSSAYVYRPLNEFPMFDLLFTTLFILLYLQFRKIMD